MNKRKKIWQKKGWFLIPCFGVSLSKIEAIQSTYIAFCAPIIDD